MVAYPYSSRRGGADFFPFGDQRGSKYANSAPRPPDFPYLFISMKNTPLLQGRLMLVRSAFPERDWPDVSDAVLHERVPDAKWIAYGSNKSGRSEIYVQSFPSPETKYAVSTTNGTQPRWRRDGMELFYLRQPTSPTETIMSVKVEPAGAGLKFGVPERLFDSYAARQIHPASSSPYSVTADGNRFLVARRLAARDARPEETPLTVVLNWNAAVSAH